MKWMWHLRAEAESLMFWCSASISALVTVCISHLARDWVMGHTGNWNWGSPLTSKVVKPCTLDVIQPLLEPETEAVATELLSVAPASTSFSPLFELLKEQVADAPHGQTRIAASKWNSNQDFCNWYEEMSVIPAWHQLGQRLVQQLAAPWSGAVVFIAAAKVRQLGSLGEHELVQGTSFLTGTTVLVASWDIKASVLEESREVLSVGSCESLSPNGKLPAQHPNHNGYISDTGHEKSHAFVTREMPCHLCRQEQSCYRCSLFSTSAFCWWSCGLLRIF